MDKNILKKYRTLGEYHKLTFPTLTFPRSKTPESFTFYQKNKIVIDFEGTMYSQIRHDREMLGGNRKIHMNGKDN
jgi:hypothetical protein